MTTLRGRLLLGLVATMLPIMCGAFGFVYVLASRSMHAQFESDTASRVETLVRMAEWWDGEPPEEGEAYEDLGDDNDNLVRFDFAELSLPEFMESNEADYYEIWDASGLVQARSPSLEGDNLPLPETADVPNSIFSPLPDGRPGQITYRRFVPPVEYDSIPDRPGTTYVLAFATSTQEISAALAVLRRSLFMAGAATLSITALLIMVVVRRGLRPLGAIATEIESIGEDDLNRRIAVSQAPGELHPIVTRLNTMLDRLQTVLERERRFTSDVAHELRTPLAELRTLAEVSARRGGVSDGDRRSFDDVKEIAIRLDRLTNTLLDLSRCSSGQVLRNLQRADLSRLIASTWKPFKDEAASKAINVEISTVDVEPLNTDPLILGTILSNLFSNAVEYTPNGGEIRLECEVRNQQVTMTLSNSTDDLVRQDLPRLSEKFWRKRGPDSRSRGHLGLGLSLVEALSHVLGARFEFDIPTHGQFRTRLIHPN